MKPIPFRIRIALLSAALSGAVLVSFGAMAWFRWNAERLAALDREIRALAYRHPGWMSNRANYERLAAAIEFIFGEAHPGQLILRVQDTSGTVLYQSPQWPPDLDPRTLPWDLDDDPQAGHEPPSGRGPGRGAGPGPGAGGRGAGPAAAGGWFTKRPAFQTVQTASGSWRVGVLGDADHRLALGLDDREVRAELRRIRNGFLTALVPALILIGAGGWWVSGLALQPLRSISRTAERVTARGLDQRIPSLDADPEITRLVQVLNGMMDRLEQSFRQAVRFSADASHELKTPLAIMQGELENALQSTPPGSPVQETFANLLDETQRLKTITRSLLLLARADAGRLPLTLESFDLSAELEAIADDARILGEPIGLALEADIPAGVSARADRTLLRQAIANLVNNAVQYNRTGGRIGLELKRHDPSGRLVLRISNTGPGIPAGDQPRVFDRFYRGDPDRSRRAGQPEGAGLGLSLAREILLAHGGTLTLVSSDPDRTVFELALPADGPSGVPAGDPPPRA